MSLYPQPFTAVPPGDARVPCAAFPPGNLYMHMRDGLVALLWVFDPRSVRPGVALAATEPLAMHAPAHAALLQILVHVITGN